MPNTSMRLQSMWTARCVRLPPGAGLWTPCAWPCWQRSCCGIYVAASLKEEFGIAILEALTSGLVVVAPAAGGPATYVEQDVTGVLVDATCPDALAGAVTHALALASDADVAVAAGDHDVDPRSLRRRGRHRRFGPLDVGRGAGGGDRRGRGRLRPLAQPRRVRSPTTENLGTACG